MRVVVCCAWLVLTFGCASTTGDTRCVKPNLIVILADQWRGQALGFLGEERVITPNLDALAAESLVLTQACVNYPVCSPFRGMLMSGQYPFKNGVYSNCNSRTAPFDCELGKSTRCWSDVLADRGYALGYIGKWHLEAPRPPFVVSYNNLPNFAWNEWTPPDRRHGFSFWHAYNTFDRHLLPEYWTTDMSRDDRLKVDKWGPEHEADVAIRYLKSKTGPRREAGKPFALVVSMNPPHMPYRQVPQRYLDRYAGVTTKDLIGDRPDLLPANTRMGRYTRRNFRFQYAMMTGVDDQVGRILRALAELCLERDTIVVFTSDHGDCLGLQGQISKNNSYELSMRVPMIVRWPGQIPARRDDLLISTPDLYPTLLDLMGLASAVPAAVEGTSHAGLFRTGQGPRPKSQLYIWTPPDDRSQGRRGVRTARYTLVIDRSPGKVGATVLRDRRTDPYQMKNLAAERPELVRKLRTEVLEPWLRRIGDPWLSAAPSIR
jgi:arylsulfatase A-like enzyme